MSGLLRERERAWLLAAKIVEYWEEWKVLLDELLHTCKLRSRADFAAGPHDGEGSQASCDLQLKPLSATRAPQAWDGMSSTSTSRERTFIGARPSAASRMACQVQWISGISYLPGYDQVQPIIRQFITRCHRRTSGRIRLPSP